jgi:nuclear pore complex protein Nup160
MCLAELSSEFLLPPTSIVLKLAQSNRFNTAMATARSLDIDMSDLFTHLTRQCLRISRSPDSVMQVLSSLLLVPH